MNKTLIGPVVILAYVNLVPYVCRVWRGLQWVAQYLPEELSGLLFFACFASLPAIPLILAFWLRRWIPITFVLSIIVATAVLSFWHHDYDLTSDAQAAIGLIFIPIYAATITGVIAGILGVCEAFIRKMRSSGDDSSKVTPAHVPDVPRSAPDTEHPADPKS